MWPGDPRCVTDSTRDHRESVVYWLLTDQSPAQCEIPWSLIRIRSHRNLPAITTFSGVVLKVIQRTFKVYWPGFWWPVISRTIRYGSKSIRSHTPARQNVYIMADSKVKRSVLSLCKKNKKIKKILICSFFELLDLTLQCWSFTQSDLPCSHHWPSYSNY